MIAVVYHNRTARMSFGNLEIKAAYEKLAAGLGLDRVERKDSEGRSRMDRAYAMTTPQEYFVECSEAVSAAATSSLHANGAEAA